MIIDLPISGSIDGRRNIGPVRDGLGRPVPAATEPATPPAASAAPLELRLLPLRLHFSDVPLAAGVHYVERLRLPPHDDAPLCRRRRLQSQVGCLVDPKFAITKNRSMDLKRINLKRYVWLSPAGPRRCLWRASAWAAESTPAKIRKCPTGAILNSQPWAAAATAEGALPRTLWTSR